MHLYGDVQSIVVVTANGILNPNTQKSAHSQARSQEFIMGGFCGVWGRSPQPPEANGGLGANPQDPSHRRFL